MARQATRKRLVNHSNSWFVRVFKGANSDDPDQCVEDCLVTGSAAVGPLGRSAWLWIGVSSGPAKVICSEEGVLDHLLSVSLA